MNSNIFSVLFAVYLVLFPLFPAKLNSKTLFTEFFLAAILIYYLAYNIKKDKEGLFKNILVFFKEKVTLILFILLIYMGISISYSTNLILALREVLRFGIGIGLVFVIKNEINTKKQVDNLIKLIYIPAFLEMIYGIVQQITGFQLVFYTGELPRIEGTMGHPNILAGYAIMLFFPLVFIFIKEKERNWRIFYFIELILLIINIVLTYSRASWIALVLGFLALGIYYSYKLLIPLVIGGGIALFIPTVQLRLSQFTDPSINSGRQRIWTLAMKCFSEHPIFGVGIGNYEAVHPQYVARFPELDPGEAIYHTHNVYLKIAAELGIIGVVIFIASIIFMYLRFIDIYKKASEYKTLIVGILISFSVFFVAINLFDNLLLSPKIMNYYFIFIGLVYAIEKIEKKA